MGKFPSVRPESVMTQTMDDDGNDYAADDDDDHRHHDDEKDDENELITKSHAAAICTIHYLHNQRGHKVHCNAFNGENLMISLHSISLDMLRIFIGYSLANLPRLLEPVKQYLQRLL